MSVRVDVAYEGDQQCSAVHALSGQRLMTDAPVELPGSKARSFSPTDLVAAGLGSCIISTLALVAQRKGIDLRGARVHIDKDLALERPMHIARMAARLSLPASLSPELRAAMESVAHHCLVGNSLSGEVKVELSFEYV